MEFKIPQPLKLEHAELHEELLKATKESGKVGEAARTVARVLHEHFVKEEKYALPPLGLLPLLAAGEISPAMKSALAMTDKLKADLPLMMAEHKAIAAALDHLVKAATEAGNTETARFAEKLKLHAQTEEEVLYPAAILIGEYLKLKLGN
jgi:hemerythrin superfamily protein